MNNIVYLKAGRNVEVKKPEVTIEDIFEVVCVDEKIAELIKQQQVYRFSYKQKDSKKNNRVVISVLKVIAILLELPGNFEIQNVGESDIIVTYTDEKPASPFVQGIKVMGVVLITGIGSAFSIMTFSNDVQLVSLFSQIYELQTGKVSDGFTILEGTYCIGLIVGILVFFNHFGKKRFSQDPTPIEVEMRLYENDIQTAIVDNYSRNEKEIGVD